jgi:hypothetical protein
MAEHASTEVLTPDEIRVILQRPPTREESSVRAVTERLRQHARRLLLGSAALLGAAGGLLFLLPPSGPGQLTNMLYVPLIFVCCAGVIGGLIGVYYTSHLKVLRSLVRDHPMVSGVVEDIWRGARGGEGMRVRLDLDDGDWVLLYPEGQRFMALCTVGERLPCLYGPDRYGAVLLQNGVIAVGAWRRPRDA